MNFTILVIYAIKIIEFLHGLLPSEYVLVKFIYIALYSYRLFSFKVSYSRNKVIYKLLIEI